MAEFQYTENQLKWFDALLSGKYRQGKEKLCQHGEYCCLGVAAEIFANEDTVISIKDDCKTFDNIVSCAPAYVVNILGLYNTLGGTINDSLLCENPPLSLLNDQDKSFKEIVEIIKFNPSMYLKQQETN